MSKLLGVLIALVIFGALSAVSTAQTPPLSEGGVVSSGNTQDAEVEQEATGDNAGNQAGIAQQNAGGDAVAEIDQFQSFGRGGASGRGAGEGGEGEGEGNGEGEDEGEGNGEGEGDGETEDATDSNTSTASCKQTSLGLAGDDALALAGAEAWLSSESARSCE